jgi:hypothetical protein
MSKTNKGDATASFVWQYRGQLCGHMRIAPWGLFQLQKAFRRSSQKKRGGGDLLSSFVLRSQGWVRQRQSYGEPAGKCDIVPALRKLEF